MWLFVWNVDHRLISSNAVLLQELNSSTILLPNVQFNQEGYLGLGKRESDHMAFYDYSIYNTKQNANALKLFRVYPRDLSQAQGQWANAIQESRESLKIKVVLSFSSEIQKSLKLNIKKIRSNKNLPN